MAGGGDNAAARGGRGPSRAANFWYHVTEGALANFGGRLVGPNVFQVMVEALGGTPAVLGSLQSIGGLSSVAPLLLAPRVEAARRKKRLALLLGLAQRVLTLLVAVLLGLLAVRRPVACLYAIGLARLAASIPASLLMAPWQDLIAETVPIQRVGRLFGFRNVLAHLLGLPSAGLCAAILALLAFPGNFILLYVISFVVMLGSSALFWRVRELPESVAPRERTPARHYFRELIAAVRSDRTYRRYLGHQAINRISFMTSGFLAFAAVQRYGLHRAEVVALAAVFGGVAMIGGNLLLPFLGERVGPKRMLAAGTFLRAAGLLLAALAPTGRVFLLTYFVLGIARAFRVVALPPLRMRIFPRGRRVGYMTLSSVVLSPVGIVTPVALGLLIQWVGYGPVFAGAAVLAVVALLPLGGISLIPEEQIGPDDEA